MVKYSLPLFLNTFWTFAPWLFDVVRNMVRRAPQRFVNLKYDGKPILQTLLVSELFGHDSIFGADVHRVRARRTTGLRGPPPDECTHHALGAVRKDPQEFSPTSCARLVWYPSHLTSSTNQIPKNQNPTLSKTRALGAPMGEVVEANQDDVENHIVCKVEWALDSIRCRRGTCVANPDVTCLDR